ncbi:MAG: biopolymer transporter ExbB [Proteobacteria bacterium]|nr:biopolymer transporter ExbB [Pseudomonadota bacterium]
MEDFGFAHFLAQSDLLGRFVLVVLVLMSMLSWTLILLKLVQLRMAAQGRADFIDYYRQQAGPSGLERGFQVLPPAEAGARIAAAGLEALGRWARRGERRLLELGDVGDFVAASLALAVARERERLEAGLAALAAIGSTAPFVGLLGTVWGIYHALVAIGVSGQGTLDKVAGPVGEALVMTAFGLAVAIPAVLAYNAFVRTTRRAAGELEGFAHEMLAFLATGVHAGGQGQTAASPAASTLAAAGSR